MPVIRSTGTITTADDKREHQTDYNSGLFVRGVWWHQVITCANIVLSYNKISRNTLMYFQKCFQHQWWNAFDNLANIATDRVLNKEETCEWRDFFNKQNTWAWINVLQYVLEFMHTFLLHLVLLCLYYRFLGPHLLTCFNINPSMHKKLHPL